MKYLGGKAGVKKKTDGSLAVEHTEMYFKDRRGQRLFAFAPDGTQASVVAKQRESAGCMFGVILLHIITIGMLNREDACERIDYFVEVTTIRANGAETITFRSTKEQASRVANHINVWAAKTRPPPLEDGSEGASRRRTKR